MGRLLPQGPRIPYKCEGARGNLPMEGRDANITNYYQSGFYYDYAPPGCTSHGV